MSWFIAPAYAADAPAAAPGGEFFNLIFLVGFAVIFYFFLWRPQSKRQKEHKNLITGLNKGDEVVTSGGILGRVSKVTDDYIVLAVSDTVELKVQKVYISAALPKGTIKNI
ncbi:preprotein translocase subunit YajC [Pokkaliibacter plantistimulans]|uniref:Sec translocon accessory complex subunit YajC n=2 Tax=Pseudomonadota TaxID=1224 RepID=A0ABX5LRC2_9GAMM|nr:MULTISPECIES: preprotein translocase subunit YajC [Pokkaliibacter]MDH2431972.1 preprotein translocase subunit YajC [Pokkaliibacter sp. MBI-7]PPC75854.1 preprotein translocase subunit YajC [Pokkaliibacter plantistimulans]PXF29209.1 preprotein translocase subunit YajC [Pokkaliibacter plantistimulans]